jgi:tetratricopeptide (TPR) repeat protein
LRDLAASTNPETAPAVDLDLLGMALSQVGESKAAEDVLRAGRRKFPIDVWLNYDLAELLEAQSRHEEAIRYYSIARALRSETAHELAHALEAKGEPDEAVAVFRDLVGLRPGNGRHWGCYGRLLQARGDHPSSRAALEKAIASLRETVRLKPDDAIAHTNLGLALAAQGKLEEAIAACRAAIRLQPDLAEAHNNLGDALRAQGKLEEAIAECRTAIRLKPDFAAAHKDLGDALRAQGKLEEAIAEYRAAIRLQPDFVGAHHNLAYALHAQGKLDEATAEYRTAIRLKPDDAGAHTNLGNVLRAQGKLAEASAAYRTAIRFKPDLAKAHYNLGIALRDQGKLAEAIAAYRAAIRLQPDYAEAHCNLGHLLQEQGRFTEALVEHERGHALGSRRADWRYPSPEWVRQARRLVELDSRFPALLQGKDRPANADEALTLADLCYKKQLHGASSRFWREVFQEQPALAADLRAQHRYSAACAAALAGSGFGQDQPPLDDAAKARWRTQALDWLRADLAAWTKALESGPAPMRESIPKTLQHWKADPDLAGLRDPTMLAKLPEDERRACQVLWSAVEAALAKARGRTSP